MPTPTLLRLLACGSLLAALPPGSALALPLPSQALAVPSAPRPGDDRPLTVPLVRDGLAPADPLVAAALPAYLQSRSAQFVDWLADGALLIETRFGDTEQIHRVRSPLGMREQLTFAPGGVQAGAVQPVSNQLLAFIAERADGGSQLYLQPLAGGVPPRAIGDGAWSDADPRWSPDGRWLAFVAGAPGGNESSVYLLDARTPDSAPRLLAAGGGTRWHVEDWSADSARLLLGRDVSATADAGRAQFIERIADGTPRPLLAPAAPAAPVRSRRRRASADAAATPLRALSARFSSDGTRVLLLTREGGQTADARGSATRTQDYVRLVALDPDDGRWQSVSAPAAHDVSLFAQSADGHYVAYTLDEDGASQLMLVNQTLRLTAPVSAVPAGVISTLRFDSSGRRLALTLQSSREPADVYVYDTGTAALTRWTRSEAGPVDAQAFVTPEALRFPTWDRPDGANRQLPALVYNPAPGTIGAGAPRPVIIWLCSGAGRQCRPDFEPFVQFLVRRLGCVVIAPQVRGSVGFGASLLEAGTGALRDDATRDIGSLLAWIGVQPGLDRGRVALLGEGYGSYFALEALTQYGDRLRGAVAAFPPALAGLANVVAIRRPVLLVQGLDNGRAPAYEAAQLREGLRAQGVQVEYLAAPDESSDFTRKPARDAYHLAAASFLARLLR